MKLLLAWLLLVQAFTASPGRVRNRTLPVAQVGTITYGISVPGGYDSADPRPLVLALHPGGPRAAYYGSRFMAQVVLPGLGELRAIVVAPDCPARSWTDPTADRALVALLENVRQDYAIDSRRILVTGFSMGGRGTWFMASSHPDLFTGAIVMAAPVGDVPLDRRGLIPTYVIHSRDDLVIPLHLLNGRLGSSKRWGGRLDSTRSMVLDTTRWVGYVDALRRGVHWIAEGWDK